MVDSSKILTVSYGTFSCTLEGFDDSFSTMKAIAEYFRDLAAGDRYFGAEPPTPDAEMLTRIAEREIARRVEMRTSGDGIVLRALDAKPATAAPQTRHPAETTAAADEMAVPTPAPAAAAATPEAEADVGTPAPAAQTRPAMPPVPQAPLPRVAAQVAAPAQTQTQTRTEAPAHPDPESVAAKLQRIRAAVGHTASQPASQADVYAEDIEDAQEVPDAAAPPTAPFAATPDPVAADLDAAFAQVADPTPAAPSDPVATIAATAPAAIPMVADQDAVPDAATQPSPLSEAETDAAIARAIATFDDAQTPHGTDTAARETPSSDAHLPQHPSAPAAPEAPRTTADDTDDQIDAVLRNLERAGLRQTRRDDADQNGAAHTGAAQDDAERTGTSDDTPAVTAEPAEMPALPQAREASVNPVTPRARILRVTRRPRPVDDAAPGVVAPADAAAAVAADHDAVLDAVAAAARPATPQMTAAADATTDLMQRDTDPSDAVADEQAAQPVDLSADDQPDETDDAQIDDLDDARDADLDADPEEDWQAEYVVPAAPAAVSVATLDGADDLTGFDTAAPSTLSDHDEADLQRTLAALSGISVSQPSTPRVARDIAAEGRNRREPLHGASEAEMSRIMTQADAQLADPGASRRRDAIAHLKAAVAATEAARQLGEAGPGRDSTEGVFRQDLDQVVRPRRAEPRPDAATDRPRPAPLKLVASQRIDLDQDATATRQPLVQPRRVSVGPGTPAQPAAAGTSAETATSFSAYAKAMGATGLPDLLEAAAAYTAFVERSEDFSRPHIMQKVRETSDTEFSREDGLRSFGTLLRQGRIERVRNGRFAVSDQIRFKPDQIAADGR
ncbi:hypothetical protein SAMN04488003_11124 [Loktanella fryxellensis]|uniref:Chemotaxis protein CheA n=1 Tax=Loktanella fryxellensis TaxID=245187 RepID=A0A1H8ELQ7_9RHOB|nr:hypothetical protein [Loktanella fryxellensis]SEN20419.1 hypothetical protein SAMN04488003_11124 [Loktanella fryxellensis]